ncbi:MAG: phytanoyl-CoA dioxygenase family protein, partial [Solimonas sp.]
FHHCLLVHGGLENRSTESRYGYAIHMQDADNRYGLAPATSRRGHVNDLLCRRGPDGHPDYADPDIFPRLWP